MICTSGDLPGPLVNTVTASGGMAGGDLVTAKASATVRLTEARVYLPIVVKDVP